MRKKTNAFHQPWNRKTTPSPISTQLNPTPMRVVMNVALRRFPVRAQMIARRMRPPSSG